MKHMPTIHASTPLHKLLPILNNHFPGQIPEHTPNRSKKDYLALAKKLGCHVYYSGSAHAETREAIQAAKERNNAAVEAREKEYRDKVALEHAQAEASKPHRSPLCSKWSLEEIQRIVFVDTPQLAVLRTIYLDDGTTREATPEECIGPLYQHKKQQLLKLAKDRGHPVYHLSYEAECLPKGESARDKEIRLRAEGSVRKNKAATAARLTKAAERL